MTVAGRDSARSFGTWCAVVLLGMGVGGAPAVAADFDAGAGYILTHDSNITRTPDPRAGQTQTVIGGLAYVDRTIELQTQLLAQAERLEYLKEIPNFNPSNAYYVNGAALWTIAPQQFFWIAQDVAREVLVDPLQNNVPSNRDQTNSLSTGPDFTIHLTTTDTAALGGRYGRFDIRGPGDNQRYSGYARWLRQLAPPRTLSLNYEAAHISFPDAGSVLVPYSKVFRQDWFGTFDARFASTNTVTIDAGSTYVTRSGGEDVRGGLTRIMLARRITPQSTLRLSLANQISDTYLDQLREVTSPTVPTEGPPTASASATDLIAGDVYKSRRRELSYVNSAAGMRYGVRAYIRDIDFSQLDLDQEERGWQIDWSWLYSNETLLYANTGYFKRNILSATPQEDREKSLTVGVTVKVSRNISLTAEGGRIERESSTSNRSFVDTRAMLLLGYSTGPLYTVKSRR